MLRNLGVSLIIHEKIKTTSLRAAAVIPFVEKLINIAKTKDKMIAIRQIEKLLQHKSASKKILEVLMAKYKDRKSGYVRKTFVGYRKGDNAHLALVELI